MFFLWLLNSTFSRIQWAFVITNIYKHNDKCIWNNIWVSKWYLLECNKIGLEYSLICIICISLHRIFLALFYKTFNTCTSKWNLKLVRLQRRHPTWSSLNSFWSSGLIFRIPSTIFFTSLTGVDSFASVKMVVFFLLIIKNTS